MKVAKIWYIVIAFLILFVLIMPSKATEQATTIKVKVIDGGGNTITCGYYYITEKTSNSETVVISTGWLGQTEPLIYSSYSDIEILIKPCYKTEQNIKFLDAEGSVFPTPNNKNTFQATFQVVDSETNLPIPDATVIIDDISRNTDSKGMVIITGIPEGYHYITYRKTGYIHNIISGSYISSNGSYFAVLTPSFSNVSLTRISDFRVEGSHRAGEVEKIKGKLEWYDNEQSGTLSNVTILVTLYDENNYLINSYSIITKSGEFEFDWLIPEKMANKSIKITAISLGYSDFGSAPPVSTSILILGRKEGGREQPQTLGFEAIYSILLFTIIFYYIRKV